MQATLSKLRQCSIDVRNLSRFSDHSHSRPLGGIQMMQTTHRHNNRRERVRPLRTRHGLRVLLTVSFSRVLTLWGDRLSNTGCSSISQPLQPNSPVSGAVARRGRAKGARWPPTRGLATALSSSWEPRERPALAICRGSGGGAVSRRPASRGTGHFIGADAASHLRQAAETDMLVPG